MKIFRNTANKIFCNTMSIEIYFPEKSISGYTKLLSWFWLVQVNQVFMHGSLSFCGGIHTFISAQGSIVSGLSRLSPLRLQTGWV